MKRYSKAYTAAVVVAVMALVLSGAIAVPLLWRGFYYLHITALDLPGQTNWSVIEIREAFDEMMDYCMWGKPFGTGVMKWSEEGYAHFADCAKLFRLDLTVLAVSVGALLVLWLLRRKGWRTVTVMGRGPLFWAGCVEAVSFAVIAGLAALDFDRAFVLFHSLFFPGKTNWIFNWRTDEIILALPQVFFRNCGILIVGVLLICCCVLMVLDLKKNKKQAA